MSVLDALQSGLAAEHAAVHQYALLGGRTRNATQRELRSALDQAYAVHRGRRDQLTGFVLDEGGEPVAAEPAYAAPGRLETADEVTAAALALELAGAETYAWLVANLAGELRAWAVTALEDAAVRGLTFRGSPEIFPGAGEYADR